MPEEIKVALIGLDTSHTAAFAKLMQDPDTPAEKKVAGLRATGCLRFETPFQNKEGLDKRQADLERIGVKVTESMDEALAGCDAIMLTINDPGAHLEYFEKVAALGKPVFIDKPLAGTLDDAKRIRELASRQGTSAICCSSLRVNRTYEEALEEVPRPDLAMFHGTINVAPAGDSLIWYGVHTFEMLQRAMGDRAATVAANQTARGVISAVQYEDGREAVVHLAKGCKYYGGRLQSAEKIRPFVVDSGRNYPDQLRQVARFFRGETVEGSLDGAVEVIALMDATRRAIDSGRPADVAR